MDVVEFFEYLFESPATNGLAAQLAEVYAWRQVGVLQELQRRVPA